MLIVQADALRADAGLGPAPGNALNAAAVNASTAGRWMFEDGMGTRSPAARSPTDRLYEIPLDPGEEAEAGKGGWESACFAEAGGLWVGGDDASAGWRNYKDLRSSLYLNAFGLSMGKPAEARFFEATGGGVGRRDAFYRMEAGRYNDWRIAAFYDATPQVSTSTYRSLWNGVGSATLTLATLVPGGGTSAGATQQAIEAALAATGNTTLDVLREKAGVRFDMKLTDTWKVHASFSDERRKGARPFGAVFGGGGGGGNFELAESIDYTTHDFLAGLQYSDPVSSFNLRASASFFRNGVDTQGFENPLFISLNGSSGLSPGVFTQGRFDLAPDNQHYNLKGEYARAFPRFYRANLTASAALGTMRQDDDLISPTEYPLTGGSVSAGGVSLANAWNTPEALGRRSAGARIDTRLADLQLSIKPATGLDVRGKLRYYETRNSMQYQACNPLTGQWGRLLNDGSGLSLVSAYGATPNAFNAAMCDLAAVQALDRVPATGNIPIRAAPNDYRQLAATLAADYRLGRASSLNATIGRESFHRDFRERDETWEDKVKLAWVDRGLIEGTIRLSYEHARRGGSDYRQDVYSPFLSAAFGPTPSANGVAVQTWIHGIEQFRSFDLADRHLNVLHGRVDYAFSPNLDGAVTLQLKDAYFPADYGRTGHQKTGSATFDLTYQAGPAAVLYGYVSRQAGTMQQKGIHPNSCILGNTYYFFSDGRVLNAAAGAAPPAAPTGTTLVGTRSVAAGNWGEACGTASPTSPLLPDSRAWNVASKDRNDVFGFGIRYDFGKVRLDAAFSRALGRTRIGYTYNPAALGLSAAAQALAGDSLSDLVFAQNTFDASVAVPINRNVMVRVLVRRESGRIRDWHHDGVQETPMPTNNAIYLDGGPQDYRATAVGVFIQVRM